MAGDARRLLGSARPTSLPVAAGRLDVGGALRQVLGAVRRARLARVGGKRPAGRSCATPSTPRWPAPPSRGSRHARVHRAHRRGTVPHVTWGFIWLMFALKIPLIALLWLVWWAVHAHPQVHYAARRRRRRRDQAGPTRTGASRSRDARGAARTARPPPRRPRALAHWSVALGRGRHAGLIP